MGNKKLTLKEIMNSLGLDIPEDEYEDEYEDKEEYEESEKKSKKERDDGEKKGHSCHVPTMKISCDLEVNVGSKNKVIYVCPGKLQYFTASAINCSGDETIEIQFCGCNRRCVYGETFISGRLGHYKIVESGIIFIPKRNLSQFPDDCFPTDILHFKAKSRCDKEVEFVVVFTFSRCVDCDCHCSK